MFNKVLIANRGEIAVRIMRTLKKMGIISVAIYAEADKHSAHVSQADESYSLGAGNVAQTYLKGDLILAIAKQTGAQAIIPGYGFLSENAEFCETCEAAGIAFVGPTPEQMRQFGLKHTSRNICKAAGVPLTPGTDLLSSLDEALKAANSIGYPIMLKSTAGGGGIGLTRCESETQLIDVFETTIRLGQNYFKDGGVFIERYVDNARHIEVQIFGDGNGNVVALGERDCSLQRRNQKVVEETPAPDLPKATREALLLAAENLGKSVNYRNAGTVEFIYDSQRDDFYFLEVNSRLQVEHPITEAVTGLDLVEWMLHVAAGTPPAALQNKSLLAAPQGAAIEVRIYAEDPLKNFQPSPGILTDVQFAQQDYVRVDTWVSTGSDVSPNYDPMIAKLIVHGKDRQEAIERMQTALDNTSIAGISTNIDYLRQIIAWDNFNQAKVSTRALESFTFHSRAIEVVQPGTYTSIQDFPGRMGYWHIGVPPSGPMDDLAFRIANRIVGNHEQAAGLECTIIGPTLKFHCDTLIALTGAPVNATLRDENSDAMHPVAMWTPIAIKQGQTLNIGKANAGCRTYLSVKNGFDVPSYLGSRSTFTLGNFGGHAGRVLRASDMLNISDSRIAACTTPAPCYAPMPAPQALIPNYLATEETHLWHIGVMYGPHGAPDFFTEESIQSFFETDWEVHYNSNRLGIRLNGPKPTFARIDGGEAGLHPSNIHDCEYAIGSINFTGDMPVILTHDGPSLGGFVCPVTIVQAELWKVGQLKPGDRIRFFAIDFDQALALEKAQQAAVNTLSALAYNPIDSHLFVKKSLSKPILHQLSASKNSPEVVYRQAGDKYILIEYGPLILDIAFRIRIHALMQAIEHKGIVGVKELSPGVRSLQVRYNSLEIDQQTLMQALLAIEAELGNTDDIIVPSRIVYLPMAFEDSATLDAVSKYRQSVQEKAPWLPNNVDFIQRINGLSSREAVKNTIFDTSYMVLGLGDVYLGAPCAVPIDPRHRLLTSKYNPARTFTAEGTVGIGGVYMCIYGMDSPGGYQLVGRTLPIWNKFLRNPQFTRNEPWLLKFFDQVRYYEVSEEELLVQREDFREGKFTVRIEESTFSLKQHLAFLTENAQSIASFKTTQQQAYAQEIEHWQSDNAFGEVKESIHEDDELEVLSGDPLHTDFSGNIWKVCVTSGQQVNKGDILVIIEAMKIEFSIRAPYNASIEAVLCQPGKIVNAGDKLLNLQAIE